jgi:hypothetical protein
LCRRANKAVALRIVSPAAVAALGITPDPTRRAVHAPAGTPRATRVVSPHGIPRKTTVKDRVRPVQIGPDHNPGSRLALSIDSDTLPCGDQPKDSSAAHAKVEVAIANVFKLILVRILIVYLPLAPPFKAMFLRERPPFVRDLIALRAGKGTPGPSQACGISGNHAIKDTARVSLPERYLARRLQFGRGKPSVGDFRLAGLFQ